MQTANSCCGAHIRAPGKMLPTNPNLPPRSNPSTVERWSGCSKRPGALLVSSAAALIARLPHVSERFASGAADPTGLRICRKQRRRALLQIRTVQLGGGRTNLKPWEMSCASLGWPVPVSPWLRALNKGRRSTGFEGSPLICQARDAEHHEE